MKIIHDYDWKGWIKRLLIRQDGIERRAHSGASRKRDALSSVNRHLLRDVGLSYLAEEHSDDGDR